MIAAPEAEIRGDDDRAQRPQADQGNGAGGAGEAGDPGRAGRRPRCAGTRHARCHSGSRPPAGCGRCGRCSRLPKRRHPAAPRPTNSVPMPGARPISAGSTTPSPPSRRPGCRSSGWACRRCAGGRAGADIPFLNDLYRSRADKAGIVYIDVWDGFVDEDGRFAQSGPDFEGQTRRLRAGDGVHFTQAGARKLAHFVEREIDRWLTRAPSRWHCRSTNPKLRLPQRRRSHPPLPPARPAHPRRGRCPARRCR